MLNGTSMSTAVAGGLFLSVLLFFTSFLFPLFSGAVIKLLQYFEQGYYPWGDKTRSNNEVFSPSSSLVKALLMSAAVSMQTVNGNQRQYNFGK